MREINTKTYLKNKKIKREDMEEIDIIICLNKKNIHYHEANKSRKS